MHAYSPHDIVQSVYTAKEILAHTIADSLFVTLLISREQGKKP